MLSSGGGIECRNESELTTASVVISETSNFPEYELAQANLVPIVCMAWIEESLRSGKLRQMGTFFPQDDMHKFMAGTCVSISGDFQDSDVLSAGLREFGCLVVAPVTVYTTHVVARSRKHDRNVMVVSTFKNNIKVVSPDWVFACFRARRRVDEAPYLLKDPTIVEDKISKADDKQQSSLLEGKKFFFGDDLEISLDMHDCLSTMVCLAGGSCADTLEESGVNIYIGQYRDGDQYLEASRAGSIVVANILWLFRILCRDRWTSPLNYLFHYPFVRGGLPGMENTVISISLYSNANRDFVTDLVLRLGGTFTRNLKSDNTHLVTLRPEGIKVQAAKSWNVLIVNHLWLEESYAAWEMKPVTDERYIFGKKVWPVGQTKLDENVLKSFYGQAEEEPEEEEQLEEGLEDMGEDKVEVDDSEDDITLAGVRNENNQESKEKPRDDAKSKLLPPVNIDDDSEEHEDEEINDENKDPDQLPVKTPSVEEVKTPKRTPGKHASTSPGANVTPSNISSSTSGDTGVTPRSSHRKAKDKAAAKLHEDISDLNEFQKRRRTRDIPLLPGESKRMKVTAASSHSSPNMTGLASSPIPETGTHTSSHGSNSSSTTTNITNKSQLPAPRVRLLITGIDSTKFSFKNLPKLGVALADDPADATHVVAPKVCRTANFLIALAHAPVLLNEQFLRAATTAASSAESLLSLDPVEDKYLLRADAAAEREMLGGATLAQVLERARHAHSAGGLLCGCTFNLTPKVRGGPDVFAGIVAAHGANSAITVRAAARVPTTCQPCSEELTTDTKNGTLQRAILIASADQKNYISAFKATFSAKKGYQAHCYTVDWLFQAILRMKLEFTDEDAL